MHLIQVKVWCIGILSFIVISCEQEIDIKLPDHTPQLVLNGLLKANSAVSFYLTASSGINTMPVSDIKVTSLRFFENGNEVFPTYEKQDSLYETNWIARSGNVLGIRIESTGYAPIYAEDTIPLSVTFTTLGDKQRVGITEQDYYSLFWFDIKDDLGKNNFYEIHLISESDLHRWETYGWMDDARVLDDSDLLFSDKNFNGQSPVFNCYYWFEESDLKLYIGYRTVSKTFYLYQKSLTQHRDYINGSDQLLGMGTPVELYSNIQGGLGVFAGYDEQMDTLIFKK